MVPNNVTSFATRLRFGLFSDRNPLMAPVASWADLVRADRRPVSADNPLSQAEHLVSNWIVKSLDALTEARDRTVEGIFMSTYGSPFLQALMGLRADGAETRRHAQREVTRQAAIERKQAELDRRIEQGSPIEAALRAFIYVRRPGRTFDEASFAVLKEINAERPEFARVTLARSKEVLREQFLIMILHEERAVAAIPKLLSADRGDRSALLDVIRRVLASGIPLQEEGKRRLARIEMLFGEPKSQSFDAAREYRAPAA